MATTAAPARQAAHRRRTGRAPTLADAETAARAVAAADPRVEQVLVFGSVARGDARPQSDIDLLVLVADCTPDDLHTLNNRLGAAAETAGAHIDLIAERRVAFEHLARNVAASFEHAIAAAAVAVYSRTRPLPPPTGTLHGVPRDNLDIAAIDAEGAVRALDDLADKIGGIPAAEKRIASDPEHTAHISPADLRTNRCISLLELAHLTIERAATAIRAAAGADRIQEHQLHLLLADPHIAELAELAALCEQFRRPDGKITSWRSASYAGHTPKMRAEATPQTASAYIAAAAESARIAARALRARGATGRQHQAAALLDNRAAMVSATAADPRSVEHGPSPAPHDSATTGRAGPALDLRLGAPGPAAEPGLLARLLRRARPAAGPAICGRRTPSGRRCRQQRPAEPGAKCAAGHDRIR